VFLHKTWNSISEICKRQEGALVINGIGASGRVLSYRHAVRRSAMVWTHDNALLFTQHQLHQLHHPKGHTGILPNTLKVLH
jgi:hypothetical protein